MAGRGRGIVLSPNGKRIAGLLALRDYSDTRYAYDVFVGDTHDAHPPIALLGERVVDVAWTPDSEHLVLTSALGFRVLIITAVPSWRADESPKGWAAARVTANARSVYFIRRNTLGCMELDTSCNCPRPISRRSRRPAIHRDGTPTALRYRVLAISSRRVATEEVFYVWHLASARPIAEAVVGGTAGLSHQSGVRARWCAASRELPSRHHSASERTRDPRSL